MRHRIAGRKLGRSSSHRRALMRTMVTELLENERMVTTVAKAKEVRSVAEKMITLGKKEHLHARRRALSFLRKKSVVFKLFDSLGPRYADRHGGYTRILRIGRRPGDSAELAVLELVEEEVEAKPSSKQPKKKKAAPKKSAKAETKEEKPKKQAKSTRKEASKKASESEKKAESAEDEETSE